LLPSRRVGCRGEGGTVHESKSHSVSEVFSFQPEIVEENVTPQQLSSSRRLHEIER
jgi:hypothetical protein